MKASSGLLTPLARLVGLLVDPLLRTWAHARLASKLRYPLPPSVRVYGVPQIVGTGRITLGKELRLHRDLYFETQDDGSITIGSGVVMARGVHVVSNAEVRIGSGSMLGEYASIRDSSHRVGAVGPAGSPGTSVAPIVIGEHVWIGRGATVLPGVTIGDGAVVGANAVVTRDVPRGLIVAGIPARPIKTKIVS
jgi:acetyltransferase-like isoleucine patch superfamily enzyme